MIIAVYIPDPTNVCQELLYTCILQVSIMVCVHTRKSIKEFFCTFCLVTVTPTKYFFKCLNSYRRKSLMITKNSMKLLLDSEAPLFHHH